MSNKCSDGFFLLSEAASIDKSMHAFDYERGLGDVRCSRIQLIQIAPGT